MKIKTTKETLLGGLQTVQNVIGSKALSTIPILSNVLIACKKQEVELVTTDLDISIKVSIDAVVDAEGSTTLPVKTLSSVVRELQPGDVEINVDEKNNAVVTAGASYFKIIGMSPDEFPPIPKAEAKFAFSIEQGTFKEMLRKTSYAVSTDETRYVLNGVLLSFKEGKLSVVATDGRRLALVETEIEFPKDIQQEMILPIKAVNELIRTLGSEGPMKIHPHGNQVIFEFGKTQLSSKLVEGKFPDYRQVIPSQNEYRIAIEREGLLGALRRMSLFASDSGIGTKFAFNKNKLTISINAPDVGEARETLPIKYTGKEMVVTFNPDFMMDPLKVLTNDEVYMEFTNDLGPAVFKCDMPFLYVLMPIRVKGD